MSAAISSTVTQAAAVASELPAARAAAAPAMPEAVAPQPAPAPARAPVAPVERGVEFHVDDSTGLTVVSVFDRNTGELIRQIPEEVVIRIARYLDAELGGSGVIDTSA